jgi:DNA oxidative demethylase
MENLPTGLTITPNAISAEHSAALQHWLQHDKGIPWEKSIEGRRVAQFGVRYDYETQSVDLTPVVPLPNILRKWLPGITSEYTQCIINEYLPNDSIPFHTDAPLFGPNILVFCLGETRPLLLQRQLEEDSPTKTFSVSIEHRYSYKMSSEVRQIWQHAVPEGTGRRTSITFRSLVPGAALCSQKLGRFITLEKELAHANSMLIQLRTSMESRLEQLHGCEKANSILVERIERKERGEKAFVAKERTWKRERAELRLENNKLAQQLLDLENEVVNFMNSKGLMENDIVDNTDDDNHSSNNHKKVSKNSKKKRRKQKKHKRSTKSQYDQNDSCPICGEESGTCVHSKIVESGERRAVGGGDDGGGGGGGEGEGAFAQGGDIAVVNHVSSDDSDAEQRPIEGKGHSKRRHWKKRPEFAVDVHKKEVLKEYSEDSDSEAEEARRRGGKVATSPTPTNGDENNNFSSLTRAVMWAGSFASSTLASAGMLLGAQDDDEEDSSEYSEDSDASVEHPVADDTRRKTIISSDSIGPSRGRNMLYLKQKKEKKPNSPLNSLSKSNSPTTSTSTAAAASAARRIKRGQGVSDNAVRKGRGKSAPSIKPPSNMTLGMSSSMKKSVTKSVIRGSGTAVLPKQKMKTLQTKQSVIRGKGYNNRD